MSDSLSSLVNEYKSNNSLSIEPLASSSGISSSCCSPFSGSFPCAAAAPFHASASAVPPPPPAPAVPSPAHHTGISDVYAGSKMFAQDKYGGSYQVRSRKRDGREKRVWWVEDADSGFLGLRVEGNHPAREGREGGTDSEVASLSPLPSPPPASASSLLTSN
eukprot:393897-Hanusia_phi.AAC.1